MCWTLLRAKQSILKPVGSRGDKHSGTRPQAEVAAHNCARLKPAKVMRWLRILSKSPWLGAVVFAFSVLGLAQQQPRREPENDRDRQLLLEFSQKSAPELAAKYFERPPYPLFVIRRLIDLADPVVLPALREAFMLEGENLTRQFLAAALVRLGDTDPRYFDYVARAALDAVNSDVPYRDSSAILATANGSPHHDEIRAWAQARGVPLIQGIRTATIELPAAVEALGEAADRRSLPIFLRGLESPNVLIVREAAFGLARLHDTAAVEPIMTACKRLDAEERPWVAKSLLYFHSKKAQKAASAMIADPARLQRWRASVNREEVMRTTVARLSRAVQRLDRAAVQLDQLREAIREGNSTDAEEALKQYVREFAEFRKELAPLSLGKQEYGLVSAVLDRLESHLSRLEQMKEYVLAGRSTSVEEPLSQVKVALRMVQDKVIKGAK